MEWRSYAISDFIPFTGEVYLRLIERVSEAWWPLHLGLLMAAVLATALALSGRRRWASLLLVPLWGWAGYGFLMQFYAELNWMGDWFGIAFFAQAALLLVATPFVPHKQTVTHHLRWSGGLLALIGIGWPLLTLLGREGWLQVEVVGVHADPTAVFTLGLVLLVFHGWWWLLAVFPLLWCVTAALTLGVLGLPQAPMLYGVVAFFMVVLVYHWVAARFFPKQ